MKKTILSFSIILFTIGVLCTYFGCDYQRKSKSVWKTKSKYVDCSTRYFENIVFDTLNREIVNQLSDSCYFEFIDYVNNSINSFNTDNRYISALDSLCVYSDGEKTELISAYIMNYFDLNNQLLFTNKLYFKSTNCLYPLFITSLIRDLDIEDVGRIEYQTIDLFIIKNYNSIATIKEINDSIFHLLSHKNH